MRSAIGGGVGPGGRLPVGRGGPIHGRESETIGLRPGTEMRGRMGESGGNQSLIAPKKSIVTVVYR